MGFEVQEFSTNIDSFVTSEVSSGANDNDSTYLGSRENSPTNHDTTLDLSNIIEEVRNLHKVLMEELSKLNLPRSLFAPGHELGPTELTGVESTTTKTLL